VTLKLKEFTADESDEMQYFPNLKVDAEDTKILWNEVIFTPTPRYPKGELAVMFVLRP